jgi:hypothetical protein
MIQRTLNIKEKKCPSVATIYLYYDQFQLARSHLQATELIDLTKQLLQMKLGSLLHSV